MNLTRRRWLQAGSGAAALTLGAGSAWWWARQADPTSARERALQECINTLVRDRRVAWWDEAHGGGVVRGHAVRHAVRQALQAARQESSFTPDRTERTQVLVVGGGMAGLCAAHALHRSGHRDVAVLELEDSAGGNSRGMAVDARGTSLALPCPMGSHYLPVPGHQATEVLELLQDWGLLKLDGSHIRTTPAGERHLCHSPQERVFWGGLWHEGLLPAGHAQNDSALASQAQRFSSWVADQQRDLGFALPSARAPWTARHAALEAQTFAQALDALGITHPLRRAHLDYCCEDDYGARASQVSAWAGVHYFASRHGFRWAGAAAASPGDGEHDERGVFTWPEGNGWMVRRLAEPLAGRIHTGTAAVRVRTERHGVTVDALHWPAHTPAGSGPAQRVRWQAERVVLATPLFISQYLLEGEPQLQNALAQTVPHMRWAPWLLTQLQIDGPPQSQPGAPLSWDNLIGLPQGRAQAQLGAAPESGPAFSLGYVRAAHQTLGALSGPEVLTHYQALGGGSATELAAARRQLLQAPASHWLRGVLHEMLGPHPDLPERLQSATLVRHGHAMSVPVPGLRALPSFQALSQAGDRVHLAHSDLSGYSVFEEACYWGQRAGRWAALKT